MTFAERMTVRPLILAGHSFGSLRAAYYLSVPHDVEPDGVVLGSLSHGLRTLTQDNTRLAMTMVEEGRGEELLPDGSWPRGFGITTVSAQTYASWSRVAPQLFSETASRLSAIKVPTLIYYGASGDVGGPTELDQISRLIGGDVPLDRRIIQGVDHGYRTGSQFVAATIVDWIAHGFHAAGPSGPR
jgi:pimeloyl-ACP methyl ester carboxylesterase